MRVVIEIACDNAIFDDCPSREFTRIVENLLDDIGEFRISLEEESVKPLFDRNGNRVGQLTVKE